MIRTSLIITRIAAQVAALGNRVYGASEFAQTASDRSAKVELPQCWVIPAGFAEGADREFAGLADQPLEELSILLAVNNRVDRTGEAANDEMRTLADSLATALVGWVPDTSYTGMRLIRGNVFRLTDELVWWDFRYTTQFLPTGEAVGAGLYTATLFAELLISNNNDPVSIELLFNTKFEAHNFLFVTSASLLAESSMGVRADPIVPDDLVLYYTTHASLIGVQPEESNSDPLQIPVGFKLEMLYAPTSIAEATVKGTFQVWLRDVMPYSWLDTIAGVRIVLQPLTLEFPPGITRS